MRRFPELFVPLFTYTASISAEEVLDAVNADENMMPEDRVTMVHLNRWISEASVESKYFGKSKSGRDAFQKCTVQTLSALWMCSHPNLPGYLNFFYGGGGGGGGGGGERCIKRKPWHILFMQDSVLYNYTLLGHLIYL